MESFFSEEDRVQLAFLRDEEVDELVAARFLPEESRLGSPLEAPVQFNFPELILHITPREFYPVLSEFNDFFRVENLELGRVPCDTLRAELLEIYDAGLQTNTTSMWESREEVSPYGIFERTMLVHKLVSNTREFLKKHGEREKERLRIHHSHGRTSSPESNGKELQTKCLAEVVRSSSEVAREFLGSPRDVVKNIPSHLRVLHVEEILRADLAKAFRAKRAHLQRELENTSFTALSRFLPPGKTVRRKEDAIDKILSPRMTFHGTNRSNVPLIVRHGFLKPGTAVPRECRATGGASGAHQVQQGSTYGRGVYSSPSPQFALDYSGRYCEPTPAKEYFGVKLIVCATLMGRSKRVDRSFVLWGESAAVANHDSHIANRDLEYVVFDVAQILPVYVIHLDWGDMNKLHLNYIPSDPTKWTRQQPTNRDPDVTPTMAGVSGMAPGERKKAKEAIMARASKWFPYGFGPVSKKNFVVEDVAEISDDEVSALNLSSLPMTPDVLTNIKGGLWRLPGHANG